MIINFQGKPRYIRIPGPWETRQQTYEQAVIAHMTRVATGGADADINTHAVVESCAGLYGRAMALATVEGPSNLTGALKPSVLSRIGRALIRCGESVFDIQTKNGKLGLLPVVSWDVTGSPNPETWQYKLELSGPSKSTSKNVANEGLLHFKYASTEKEPWVGISPLQHAAATGTLASNLELRMGEEAGGQVGRVLPIPGEPSDPKYAGLVSDLKSLRGGVALVPSQDAVWSQVSKPSANWGSMRFGPELPMSLDAVRKSVIHSITASCGVPVALTDPGADATALRESFRQFVHLSLMPLGRLIGEELSEKLETPISFEFRKLAAGDVQGRARAFKALVDGGIKIEEAKKYTLDT